jgi:CHAD domain-containing protein
MSEHGGKQLIDALDEHWRKYRKLLKACRQNTSEDNVHELRVRTRRLISLIELLNSLAPQAAFAKIRKALKKQLDQFDELRDTQVMLFEVAKNMPILPELEPFLAFMHQREQQLLIHSASNIASFYQSKLRRKVKKASKHFERQIANTDLTIALPTAIDQVYALAIAHYQTLDPANSTSIHQLRIAVKKWRYTLLSVQALISCLPETGLKQLQAYLSQMGDIQNSVVLLQTLNIFFADKTPFSIEQYYLKQQQDLIQAFMTHAAEILEFRETAERLSQ